METFTWFRASASVQNLYTLTLNVFKSNNISFFKFLLKIKRKDTVKSIACSTCTLWGFSVKKIWCSSPKMKKFLADLIGITIINQSNLLWVCTNSRDNLFRQFRFLSRRYFRATVQVLLWEVGWSTVVFYLNLLPWNCILTGCNWLMEKRYFNSCEIKRMKEWIKCVPKHRHVRKRASKSLCIKPKTIKSRRFKDSTGKSQLCGATKQRGL